MTVATVEPDWPEIEALYRAGKETLRAIADRYDGLNHVAIKRKADKEGWVRDLSWKIAKKAEDLVTRDAVTKHVTRLDSFTEKQIVDANAEQQASVIRGQRKDVTRYRGLVAKLFDELERTTDGIESMEQLGELMATPDEAEIDKLNELYRKVISLPGRVDMAKKLAETLEKLVNVERRVFNIKDTDGEEERVVKIHEIRLVGVRPQGRIIDMEDA